MDIEKTWNEIAWEMQRRLEHEAWVHFRSKIRRPAVIAFGRFNPPTVGHERLIRFLKVEAAKRQAAAIVFPSPTQDDKRNPLPFAEKVGYLRAMFPGVVINGNASIRTPVDALTALAKAGFDAVWFVVGSDEAGPFEKFAPYAPTLKQYGVLVVPGERNPRSAGVQGMSATKLRAAVKQGRFQEFASGLPTRNERLANRLYFSLRSHMVTEKKHAFLFYGSKKLVEAFDALKVNAYRKDLTGMSYVDIRSLHAQLNRANYKTYIYVQESLPVQMTEGYLRRQTTYGFIREHLVRDVVALKRVSEMVEHVRRVLKEEEAPKPKEPSEVDRLKVQQKQEILATKERQNQQLLQAKQRELQKKSREDAQKIQNGTKPKSITR